MPRKVQYRDFPGGPVGIEFSDELPHWNLCGICGMLSAIMYRDELGHVFCKVCIDAHRQNKRIFCKHENRFVELADLYEALEVIQLTHDLTVFCPYKTLGCTEYRPLRFMRDHQNQCQRRPEPSHQEENCRADQTGQAIEDNMAVQQTFSQEAWEEILNLQERIAEMEQRKREDDQSRLCLEVCIADQDKLLQDYMEKNKKLEQKIRELEDRQREDDQARLNMKDHIAGQEKLLQDILEQNLKLQEKPTGLEDQVFDANAYHLEIQDHINRCSKWLQDMANEVARCSREPAIQTMGHDLSNRIKTCFNYVTKSVRGLPEQDLR